MSSLDGGAVRDICRGFNKVSMKYLKKGFHAEIVTAKIAVLAVSIVVDSRMTKRNIHELKAEVLFALSEYIDQVYKESMEGK